MLQVTNCAGVRCQLPHADACRVSLRWACVPSENWSCCVQVLSARLDGSDWLAGGQYSVADIAAFIWVLDAPLIGVPLLSRSLGWTPAVFGSNPAN